MRRTAYWVATFFGTGLSLYMPGTVGSLASLIIWAPMVLAEIHPTLRLVAALAVFLVGLWSCHASSSFFQAKDPQAIVIDEVAGQGLALALCPPSWSAILLCFFLFRFFDITKIWPASWADKQLHGPLGIMLDDIVAGLYTVLVFSIVSVTLWN